MSGDHTMLATKQAIERVVEEDADDYFVFVVSDANFGRYGIDPRDFGKLLVADERVRFLVVVAAT